MPKALRKLVIIDGNALIHRSFHALPPTLRTKSGLLVNAVYGFASFLLKALKDIKPEFVVLTLDMKGPTFRHEAYGDYKATRTKAPDELYAQIPLVKEIARAFSIPILELSGYEADDLIGTICAQTAKEKSLERIIITGDLDTLQLVDKHTKVYTMSRGLNETVLYGEEEVKQRYGLRPDQIIDYKALRGDPSDNIPGVRGIGEKTACELLIAFQTLDGVYEAVKNSRPEIKPRIKDLLTTHRDDAYLSRELATINQAAPINFSLDGVGYCNFQLSEVSRVFNEYEFRSLLSKAKELKDSLLKSGGAKISGPTEPAAAPARRKSLEFSLLAAENEFLAWLKKLSKQKSVALSLEADGPDPLRAKIIGLAFSWQVGKAAFVPADKKKLLALAPVLKNPKIKKIGHNLKPVWRFLRNAGLQLEGVEDDTMLCAFLLEPARRLPTLESLAFAELGQEPNSPEGAEPAGAEQPSFSFGGPELEKLGRSAAEKAEAVYRLAPVLRRRLKQAGMEKLYREIELPLIAVLGEMENTGIRFENKSIAALEKEVGGKLAKLEKTIHELAGEKFNINSTKQLKEVLFEKLAISTAGLKRTKTGFSTAEEELIKLRDRHPVIALLQEYRELSKLQSTYIKALPLAVNPQTGRLHTTFNQTIAATGRLSSTDPNLQNIPTRTAEGQKIRRAFTAAAGWQLASFDYSQIELRLAAHISGDPKMIAAFRKGEDIHAATAAEINNVPLGQVTKEMRREAKAINFGILYGQGPHGLSQGAGLPYAQAVEFIKKYFRAYPRVKKMMEDSIEEARERGYSTTLFGRRRPLPELQASAVMIRKAAERMAINTPLQGTAADLIKRAMVEIFQRFAAHHNDIRLVLQVHDELIFEIKKDKVKTFAPEIKRLMAEALKMKVPVIVEESVGDNWGDLK